MITHDLPLLRYRRFFPHDGVRLSEDSQEDVHQDEEHGHHVDEEEGHAEDRRRLARGEVMALG